MAGEEAVQQVEGRAGRLLQQPVAGAGDHLRAHVAGHEFGHGADGRAEGRIAAHGEEVLIARGGRPAVRLVPAAVAGVRLGASEGVVALESVPDFLEPMDADGLADWET